MKFDLWRVSSAVLIASLLAIGGCDDGDDGAAGPAGPAGATGAEGPAGPQGADVDPATVDDLQSQIDAVALGDINPESCSVCHGDIGEDEHQSIYDNYADASTLALTIDGVASVANGDGTFTSTATFTLMQNGAPYTDVDGLPSLEQQRIYAATYDTATRLYDAERSATRYRDFMTTATPGQYTATAVAIPFAPELSHAQVFGYFADDLLHTEHAHAGADSHVHLYNDVASAAMAFGDANATDPDAYTSYANVAGCEKCHGKPYMKHGYRAAEVDGLPDFAACKSCHFDDRDGGHEDWQILVDNPDRFGEIHAGDDLTPEEETKYAYKAKLMNDVHMAHGMEFPYPQSIATCNVCHEGKLDMVLADEFFEAETCKSCHPVTGPVDASGHLHDEDGERYTHQHRAPALEALWDEAGAGFHSIESDCNAACHTAAAGVGPVFSSLHSGYDHIIYADDGTRYADAFVVTVDDANLDGNMLTVNFSAAETVDIPGIGVTDIVPTLMIGLYGYNSHQYIVYPHGRDEDRNRLTEYPVDGTVNPRFTTVTAAGGMWEIDFDLSMWADMVADGTIKRAEIGVLVDQRIVVGERDSRSNGESDDTIFGMTAPSRTFDMVANAFDDDYFPEIVRVEDGCDNCHDLLATSFHSPTRGGSMEICKMCHAVSTRGSHLELASRSIDNYVHSIHSFQPFDPGDVDFTDLLETAEYELHLGHVFPNFTIFNCEACHNPGTYNVPDQSKSMPSLHSGTDSFDGPRNIGTIGQFVTGPASRACGACHRAHALKDDNAGALASFNQHTASGGYMIDDGDGVWEAVVEEIMSMFE